VDRHECWVWWQPSGPRPPAPRGDRFFRGPGGPRALGVGQDLSTQRQRDCPPQLEVCSPRYNHAQMPPPGPDLLAEECIAAGSAFPGAPPSRSVDPPASPGPVASRRRGPEFQALLHHEPIIGKDVFGCGPGPSLPGNFCLLPPVSFRQARSPAGKSPPMNSSAKLADRYPGRGNLRPQRKKKKKKKNERKKHGPHRPPVCRPGPGGRFPLRGGASKHGH